MPPLFRHTAPSDRKCGLCHRLMVKLLGFTADWFACPGCDSGTGRPA